MAKQQIPMMPKAGGGVLGKVVGLGLTAGILMLIVKQPAEAAAIAKGIVGGLGAAAEAVATFLTAVMG